MKTFTRSAAAATLAAGIATLGACGSSGTSTVAAPPAAAPAAATSAAAPASTAPAAAGGSIDVADQSGDGKSVKITAVDLEAGGQGGWIALHKDLDGKPGPVMYELAVPAGKSTDLSIATPGGIVTGAYWPMLHVDDHTIGTYEFPTVAGADLPIKADGMIVMKKITVTVG